MATIMSRPAPPALDTPASATFPSELKTQLPLSPTVQIKHEEPLQTPLTPPAAYLDFLAKRSSKNMSPPSSATFKPVLDKPSLTSYPSTDSVETTSSIHTVSTISTDAESVATETPNQIQELPARTESPDSESSTDSFSSMQSAKSEPTIPALPRAQLTRQRSIARIDTSGAITRPRRISAGQTSPFTAIPHSAHTPRRLCIPQSPYSPRVQTPHTANGMSLVSPATTHGMLSPSTSTLMSPMTGNSLMSPMTGNSLLSPYSIASPIDAMSPIGSAQQMTLKHVMTRTVTIARPNAPIMEPVPASKKRRIEGPSSTPR